MVVTDVGRLRRALSDTDFPAERDELVGCAELAGADHDTLPALRAMPPVSYANFAEVLQSVSLTPDRSPADKAAQRRLHTKPGLAEQEKEVPGHPSQRRPGATEAAEPLTKTPCYSPQEPRSRWKYLALAQWQSWMPTMTPAIVMRAGR